MLDDDDADQRWPRHVERLGALGGEHCLHPVAVAPAIVRADVDDAPRHLDLRRDDGDRSAARHADEPGPQDSMPGEEFCQRIPQPLGVHVATQ